jgi:hypothetical protein
MLNVLITIDAEIWPLNHDWRTAGLKRDIDRDMYGATAQGQYGLRYQLDVLNRHSLKAVFFLEPLFAAAAGMKVLQNVVDEIQSAGQEIQLHLHSEWLAWTENTILPNRTGSHLINFTEDEQTALIKHGLQRLQDCGVKNICAFRAGSFGADFATLSAAARNGITFDSSHNAAHLNEKCKLDTQDPLLQPRKIYGIWEFPVTVFSAGTKIPRPAQITACSSSEMQAALLQAWQDEWYSFTLVSHTFELLKRRRTNIDTPQVDPIVLRRFEWLCEFLDENRDKFRTVGFADIDEQEIPQSQPERMLSCGGWRTGWRLVEQSIRRIY